MFTSLRSHRTRQKSKKPDRRFSPGFLGTEGMLEQRLLLSTIPPAAVRPTYGAGIETSGPFYVNSWMDVQAVGHGSGAAGFATWGELEFNYPSPGLGTPTGVSDISSVSMQINNTSAPGTANYGAKDGSFSIYVIPNNTVPASSMTLVGSSGGLGSINVPGVTITSADLVGTWSTTALTTGYTTYTGSTTGSTSNNPSHVTGSSAVLGSDAISWMKNAMNTGQNVRFAVVANDTSFQTDWEGNYSSNYPLLQLNATTAPDVNFQNAPYTVTETDQVPAHTTPLTFNITRQGTSSDLANPTTIHWAAANSTVPAGGFTAQNGNVVFPAGVTSEPVTINFNNISTTQLTGVVNITLSDPGGNTPAPVFYATTTTGTINYLQAVDVNLSPATVTVDESAGTVSLTVTRTGSGVATLATTVNYATANGTPYLASNDPNGQAADDAQAGRDYTATSGTLSWAAGDGTTRTITVPILDVETFNTTNTLNAVTPPTTALSRYFTVSLSGQSNGTAIGAGQSTVTITPDNWATSHVLTSAATPTHTNEVEPGGPYLPYTDSWMAMNSNVHNSFGYQDMPELEWTYAGQPSLYPTQPVRAVDTVRLSIYNTAISGGYGGTPGSFDVYILDDNSVADTSLTYQGGPGATGPVVIGSQATPLLLGTAYFPNNVVGYNDFTFDNIHDNNPAASASLTAKLNAHQEVRFVITPSLGSPVAADWEGNWVQNQPQLNLMLDPQTLPFWLSPASAATWNASTHTLTVTGAATIQADPGADSPNIVENAAADQLTISPATVGFVNLGGVTLTNGASITVPSVGASRTHTNHNTIVIDAVNGTLGTFSIDATSKFDLVDNDMILQDGGAAGAAAVQALATTGRNLPAGNTWTGNGLTSSAAAAVDGNLGYEQNLLAVALNGDLPLGAYASWQAGAITLTLNPDDVIVKYTYNGDFTLDGKVDANDYTVFGTFYDAGASTGNPFIYGDTNGDGTIDATDYTYFATFYGLGTSGAPGDQL